MSAGQLSEDGEVSETSGVRAGIRAGLPLAVAGLADGLIFGVLARQAGISPIEATLMSALVCAGTAQFLTLGLWGSPLPIAMILMTTLGVNLRHLLMGATMRQSFSAVPARRLYPVLHFLSDESWALATRERLEREVSETFVLGAGVILAGGWVGTTLAGATIGAKIDDPARWGLDFAWVAVFAALMVTLWPGRAKALSWVAAGAAAILGREFLPTGWHVLAGGVVGTVVGVIRHDA